MNIHVRHPTVTAPHDGFYSSLAIVIKKAIESPPQLNEHWRGHIRCFFLEKGRAYIFEKTQAVVVYMDDFFLRKGYNCASSYFEL